jgi:hypothetical protein
LRQGVPGVRPRWSRRCWSSRKPPWRFPQIAILREEGFYGGNNQNRKMKIIIE